MGAAPLTSRTTTATASVLGTTPKAKTAQRAGLADAVLATWKTNNRVTVFLFENLPSELWAMVIPGMPRRTVRMIAGHVHNARCLWIKTLGKRHGIRVPRSVTRHPVPRPELFPPL